MINKHYAVLVNDAINEASQKLGDYIDALLRETLQNDDNNSLDEDNIVAI